ncbi:hypothetical protein [Allorhizocola rhizosphaerae]|uniref:hypothetical protein n=1 Tax=Allorhizocola rhizosphaerae TaxID=1872709 RepID=UPI000E3DFB8E|nr:hypothetical protein [Allorhizocola rhizosphaerae]
MVVLKALDPTATAAAVSAIVALAVSVMATFLSPMVKYRFDQRLESRKLELTYRAEQSKALRDRIAHHKGSVLSAVEELNDRIRNYHDKAEAPTWLGNSTGYYERTFAFRIISVWYVAERFTREAIYIDSAVALPGDSEFVRAMRLNLEVWSSGSLFDGLPYSGASEEDHFFRNRITSIVEEFSDDMLSRSLTWTQFQQTLDDGNSRFAPVFGYLDKLERDPAQLKYQRLVAVHLVGAATLNSFGYDYQRMSPEHLKRIAARCGPEVRANLRQLVLRLHLQDSVGFRELVEVLGTDV